MKDKSSTNKTATITVKIDSQLKNNVEDILNRLGLNHSSVIQVLYNQIELTNSGKHRVFMEKLLLSIAFI